MSKILLYKTANKFNESLVDNNYKVMLRFFKINALGLGIYLELIFLYLDFHKTVKFILMDREAQNLRNFDIQVLSLN